MGVIRAFSKFSKCLFHSEENTGRRRYKTIHNKNTKTRRYKKSTQVRGIRWGKL